VENAHHWSFKIKMRYKFSDAVENFIGAISATLFFFALRGGTEGPFIDYKIGIGISVLWFFLLYGSFKKRGNGLQSFAMAIVISATICTFFSIAFGLATWNQMNSLTLWLGSPAMITTLMAVPVALLFDKLNIKSVLSRYYIKK
jgi:hypothetical protein